MSLTADLTAPVTCPTCGDAKSHDIRHHMTLALLGRVFNCGAAISIDANGGWFTAIVCRRAGAIIAELRAEVARLTAENRRVGDMNVLMATELNAISDLAEAELGPWLPVVIEHLPEALYFARNVYDLAVEALAGNAPAADHANSSGQGDLDLCGQAAERVADPARSS